MGQGVREGKDRYTTADAVQFRIITALESC